MGSKRHVTGEVTPCRHALPCGSWENPAWGSSVLGQLLPCLFLPPSFLFFFFFPFYPPVLFLCFVSWFGASGPGTWGAGMGAARGCSLVSAMPLSHARASPMLELVLVLPGIPRAAVPRRPQSHLTQYTVL